MRPRSSPRFSITLSIYLRAVVAREVKFNWSGWSLLGLAMAEARRTLTNRRGFDGLSRLHPTLRRYDEVWRPTGSRSAPASPSRTRSMQCAPRPSRWAVELSERTEALGPGAGRLLMAVVLPQPLRRGWHRWCAVVRHRANRKRKVLQLLAPRQHRRKARALARWRVASGHAPAGCKTDRAARRRALAYRLEHATLGPEKLTQAPLHLPAYRPCISPISAIYLPYICPLSRLYLPSISPISHAGAAARAARGVPPRLARLAALPVRLRPPRRRRRHRLAARRAPRHGERPEPEPEPEPQGEWPQP